MPRRLARAPVWVALAAALAPPSGFAAPARSQDAEPPPPPPVGEAIKLEAVLATAIRRSPTLESATIDVEVARAEVLRAAGITDFLLFAGGSFSRRKVPTVAGETYAISSVDTLSFEAGLSKVLPTGGTIGIQTTLDRSRQEAVIIGMEQDESTRYDASVTAFLDQPLLRGFGPNATYAAEHQAEQAARAAVLQRRATAQGVVRDLISAYWEVSYAQADLAIRRSSLDLARERRRLTEASVRLGQVAPTEVVAVDQIIATREEEILGAELSVAERSLELRRLAGLPINAAAVELAPGEPLAVEAAPPSPEQVLRATFETSPELAALAARGEGARLEVEVSENGTLPRLDVSLSFGPAGSGADAGEAYGGMVDRDGYLATAGLRFEHALENRAARGRRHRAEAELRRVSVDDRTLRLELALAAVRAVKLADSAQKRISLSQRAIELSEKNVKAETGRFELGKSTNFDVLARQEELKQARLRRARAVVDYLKAMAIIDALTGQILGKYGIRLDPP